MLDETSADFFVRLSDAGDEITISVLPHVKQETVVEVFDTVRYAVFEFLSLHTEEVYNYGSMIPFHLRHPYYDLEKMEDKKWKIDKS